MNTLTLLYNKNLINKFKIFHHLNFNDMRNYAIFNYSSYNLEH